jgi:hypothetical protein
MPAGKELVYNAEQSLDMDKAVQIADFVGASPNFAHKLSS